MTDRPTARELAIKDRKCLETRLWWLNLKSLLALTLSMTYFPLEIARLAMVGKLGKVAFIYINIVYSMRLGTDTYTVVSRPDGYLGKRSREM